MGPSVWQILIVLLVVLLLFGTKRLRNVGSDLGAAIKGFRSGMKDAVDDEPGKLGSDGQGKPAEREPAAQDKQR